MNVIAVNSGSFKSEVLESPLPVLVDAYRPDCRPCQVIAPVLEELADEMRGRVKVVKFDAEAELYLSAALRVASVPTLLVFKGGQEVVRMVGLRTKAHLQEALLGVAA